MVLILVTIFLSGDMDGRLFLPDVLPQNSGGPIQQVTDISVLMEPMLEVTQEIRGIGAFPPVGQVIVDPESILLGPHEPCFFKHLHVF
jgi:hypothetical protein